MCCARRAHVTSGAPHPQEPCTPASGGDRHRGGPGLGSRRRNGTPPRSSTRFDRATLLDLVKSLLSLSFSAHRHASQFTARRPIKPSRKGQPRSRLTPARVTARSSRRSMARPKSHSLNVMLRVKLTAAKKDERARQGGPAQQAESMPAIRHSRVAAADPTSSAAPQQAGCAVRSLSVSQDVLWLDVAVKDALQRDEGEQGKGVTAWLAAFKTAHAQPTPVHASWHAPSPASSKAPPGCKASLSQAPLHVCACRTRSNLAQPHLLVQVQQDLEAGQQHHLHRLALGHAPAVPANNHADTHT
jgi:hypothetical protein